MATRSKCLVQRGEKLFYPKNYPKEFKLVVLENVYSWIKITIKKAGLKLLYMVCAAAIIYGHLKKYKKDLQCKATNRSKWHDYCSNF